MGRIETHLKELKIDLPQASTPGASYVPFVRTGQLPQWNGERCFVGKLGREFSVDQGQQAARLCALNLIAHLRRPSRMTSIRSSAACASVVSLTQCRTLLASRR